MQARTAHSVFERLAAQRSVETQQPSVARFTGRGIGKARFLFQPGQPFPPLAGLAVPLGAEPVTAAGPGALAHGFC